jgi:photosystem II stability/assembly factor-like uncharacterized protein
MKRYILFAFISLFLLSNNLSAQWKSLNGLITGAIHCIAQHKNNLNETIIYVGSTDGLFVSRDSGTSWELTDISNNYISAIIINGTFIYVGTGNNGVYRSIDEGKSWQKINNGLNENTELNVTALSYSGSRIFVGSSDLHYSDDNGDTWIRINAIAGSVLYIANYHNRMVVVSSSDIYFSNDFGNTWQLVSSHGYVWCVAINSSKIFIGSNAGVEISSNNGISWNSESWNSEISNGICISITADEDTLFAICEGFDIYRSTDNGNSWTPTGLRDYDIYAVSKSGNIITAGSIMGDIYISTNLGKTWTNIYASLHYSSVGPFIFSGSDMFAGVNNHIYHSTNNGSSWTKTPFATSDQGVSAIKVIGENIYVATRTVYLGDYASGSLYLSTDYWKSWTQLSLKDTYVTSIFDDNGKIIVGKAYGAISISTDNGISWSKNDFTTTGITSIIKFGSLIFAGGYEGLFVSSDEGLNWTKIFNSDVSSLFTNGSSIYIGGINGVYVSNDNGLTFSQIGNMDITAIAFHGNYIYTCGPYGILYVTSNNGLTWSTIDTGSYSIHDIIIQNDDIILFGDPGIFSTPISNLILTAIRNQNLIPLDYSLKQNYPNPFNPTTKIEFDLPLTSVISLEIFDILGRKVTTLINGEKVAGKYNVTFNASSLSSGFYFYTLRTKDFIQTKKMILIK